MPDKPFKRILLKLSGESLKGNRSHGIDPDSLDYMADEIKSVTSKGIELGIVVGGGNIWRGSEAEIEGMERASADYAGMLATVISALALQDSLERKHKLNTRTLSAINIQQVAEPYIRRRAIRHLEKGRIVLFAAGTGNPFVTTDTGAALRALEIEADVLLMAKNDVDGVYDKDPKLDDSAVRYENISYLDAIEKRLKVMDSTALSLCMEYSIPIVVFDLSKKGNLNRIVSGEKVGTLVAEDLVTEE
ncbi:MAG: UMP kinase [Dehalococcoidia bacterium]|jgi:uridylate kinase|nr:UMP kinase [Dehalococcoidia bacterium]MEC7913721.1 UMP kinase [Chloroflexota bacterium]MBV45870.1 UMP kinase [Dehalococcoidia bacterium]MCS5650987.1 UMP kinase [Dehalococcoidia bacterium]HAT22290.1 UMP kinase [Dehalococcoidia bacterium]|tara:strand:+ start:1650 stop:2390 length:741 start_codon:yes stop_codon:yes gene_type:complete